MILELASASALDSWLSFCFSVTFMPPKDARPSILRAQEASVKAKAKAKAAKLRNGCTVPQLRKQLNVTRLLLFLMTASLVDAPGGPSAASM